MNTFPPPPVPTFTPNHELASRKATTALVLGIVACALGWLIPAVGIVCGIIALVMGSRAKKLAVGTAFASRAMTAWILGIVGVSVGGLFFLVWMNSFSTY